MANEGLALRRSAPETSYSPLCKHGRRLEFTGCAECEIEYPAFRIEIDPIRKAKDVEAGRTGNDPDYEGEDEHGQG